MNVHPSRPGADMFADIDRAVAEIERGPTDIAAPSLGSPTRQAVGSLVDGLVTALHEKTNWVRRELDLVDQRAVTSAAKSKHALLEHAETCEQLNDAVDRLREVATALAEKSRDL